MRYDREENSRRGQSNRRPGERYHQFGAEEDRSMRDYSRGRPGSPGRTYNDNSLMDDDYFREQSRNYEGESRSNFGADSNFGGRSSSFSRSRDYGESAYDMDPYPTQNRSDYSYRAGDRNSYRDSRDSFEDRAGYRDYSGERFGSGSRYFGDFAGSRYGSYDDRHHDSEHRTMWESVKDFFGVGPKGYSRSDERIREDVSDALTRDRAVDASEIEVDVKEGVVSLRGSVSDKWMKRRAEDCAEEITGVRDVRNELEIRREGGMSSMSHLSEDGRTGSIGTGGALSNSGTGVGMRAGSTNKGSKRKLS